MTAPRSSNHTVGSLAPALALAALALGVVALVAPLPFLPAPKPPQVVDQSTTAATRPVPTVTPIVPDNWSAMAEQFAALREPVPDMPLVDPKATEPVVTEVPTTDSGPAYQPLRWRYLGSFVEPNRTAALVLMNDTNQRILYPGQRLIDEFDPDQVTIHVISVTEREIVIDRAGREQRFQLSLPPNEPASATSPLRTPPRGGTPSRRR